jgi:hypothetical protein
MDHALHIGLWPFEDRFYPAIAEIANPAANANAPGLITGIGAKADALYPPADHNASAADCARIAVLHDHALIPWPAGLGIEFLVLAGCDKDHPLANIGRSVG